MNEPYQARVMGEHTALKEKIEKLDAFLVGEVFKGLELLDQQLLLMQRNTMSTYLGILSLRIGRFESE